MTANDSWAKLGTQTTFRNIAPKQNTLYLSIYKTKMFYVCTALSLGACEMDKKQKGQNGVHRLRYLQHFWRCSKRTKRVYAEERTAGRTEEDTSMGCEEEKFVEEQWNLARISDDLLGKV